MPLHWSLVPGSKTGSQSASKEGVLTTNIQECESNWLLATKYSSLPRHRGSLRLRHHLRPETSLPMDQVNGNNEKTKWISELHHSFQRMPDKAFETPSKDFRRTNFRKQTALVMSDQSNANPAMDDR